MFKSCKFMYTRGTLGAHYQHVLCIYKGVELKKKLQGKEDEIHFSCNISFVAHSMP
jgi:hypothetical protein